MSNKKLDILFIHANASSKVYQALSKNHSAIEPPIWAAMLANHCRSRGFSVQILDCEAERLNNQPSADLIKDMNPKIACFVVYGQQPSASTQNMEGSIDTAKKLKLLGSDIKILFVGGHISALPRETLSEDCVDLICQNEGVYTISDLLKVENLNDKNVLSKVSGLGYKDKQGNVILNKTSKIVNQKILEKDLPGMAWDLLPDINKYRTSGWHSWSNNTIKTPFASLYTSLGCPYKCSFCMINIINRIDSSPGIVSSDSAKYRHWSPEFVIKQLDYFANLGIKNIKIADELFVLKPRHFLKICDLIIERGYDFNIWCYSRIDTCKQKYLDKLKKAGVKWLALGIENPNQILRKEVVKGGFQEVKILDIINQIREAGINVSANFIFGLPYDTQTSMRETLDFAIETLPEMANFYTAMAYPGSPLYLTAKRNNWKLPESFVGYSQHSYYTQNLPTKYCTAEEVLEFRDKAWTEFHTNKNYIQLLDSKFGKNAKENIVNVSKIKLKRKILGD